MESASEETRRYAELVRKHVPDALSESCNLIKFVRGDEASKFAKIDGNYFHQEQIASEWICSTGEDERGAVRQELVDLLQLIYNARDKSSNRLGPPPSFYALLLADGDRLGKLVGTLGGKYVGNALANFTKEVQRIVETHCGVSIYAGGDDVMAMLPVMKALSCADVLAREYRTAFGDHSEATLSATVLFSHVRSPLSKVLSTAHCLLDDVAKEGNGRDSLVAAVLNPRGLSCQWVTTWERAGTGDEGTSAVYLLNKLVGKLKQDAAETDLSSALIYRMRETLSELCGWVKWTPGEWGDLPDGLDIRNFLYSDVLHSLTIRTEEGAEDRAKGLMDLLLGLLDRSQSTAKADSNEVSANIGKANVHNTKKGIDALLLARFLANQEHAEEQ